MGADVTSALNSMGTGPGGMGPAQQAIAQNAPDMEMANTARGMDPRQGTLGASGGKSQNTPPAPRPIMSSKMGIGQGMMDAGTPSGGMPMQLAQLLAQMKNRRG